MATHNVQTNEEDEKAKLDLPNRSVARCDLRIERENFSSHEIHLLYRFHVCNEIGLPHRASHCNHTIATDDFLIEFTDR